MLHWLLENKSDEYDFKIVFANTGRENNETLEFVNKCAIHFDCEIVWIEARFGKGLRVDKGNKHKVVSYKTATRNQDWKNRNDTPYEQMVMEYGLAGIKYRHSTRELKLRAIDSYMRSLGFKKSEYDTFIGIRSDEFDRVSKHKDRDRLIYPLVNWIPLTKNHINFWWNLQPFRLELKGWEGNCVTCYKKSENKLIKIMQDHAWKFEFDEYLERKYSHYIPPRRKAYFVQKNKPIPTERIYIFRENRTVQDIRELSLTKKVNIEDEAMLYEESCDIYSNCGEE